MYTFDQDHVDQFVTLAKDFIEERKITTVAGPVLSGAVIASVLAARISSIEAVFLAKPTDQYQCRAHARTGKRFGKAVISRRVLLVDDCIAYGTTLEWCLSSLGYLPMPVAILFSHQGYPPYEAQTVLTRIGIPAYCWEPYLSEIKEINLQ